MLASLSGASPSSRTVGSNSPATRAAGVAVAHPSAGVRKNALQALAGDSSPGTAPVTWSVVGPALAWVAGLIACTVPWAIVVYRRRI